MSLKLRLGRVTRLNFAPGVDYGSVLFARNELFRVEELAVRSSANLIHDGRLQIDHNATGHVLASAGFGKERIRRAAAVCTRAVKASRSSPGHQCRQWGRRDVRARIKAIRIDACNADAVGVRRRRTY